MITIPTAVEQIIKKKPFLENALIEGIINLSSLARMIMPDLEIILGKPANLGAVIMALNRLVPRLELTSTMKFKKVVENIGDIIVRSGLVDYSFENSKSLYSCQSELLERIKNTKDIFCTFSQGINETTLIVSNLISDQVENIFSDETLITKTEGLSSLTVKLPFDNTICPGVYYFIFKELAWDNINITEVISTTNEFTVLVKDSDVQEAFNILMLAKRSFKH
ncbi:MAG: aspartate kinase [Rikenellaceae bacterium]